MRTAGMFVLHVEPETTAIPTPRIHRTHGCRARSSYLGLRLNGGLHYAYYQST